MTFLTRAGKQPAIIRVSLLLKKLNCRMEEELKRDCSLASRLIMIFSTDSNLNTLGKSINIEKDYVVV